MRAEQPAAFPFILQDDIYLLNSDKAALLTADAPAAQPVIDVSKIESKQPEPVAAPVVTETPAPSYNYLGENKKRFLILTHYANDQYIAADHLAALQNILKRKDLEISDVAILNTGKNVDTGFDALMAFFNPQKLLILGNAALPKGIAQPVLNQPAQQANTTLLYSFSFDEMMSSTDNKKAFWDQMKNL